MALENVFSWSKSRAEELKECQRKYFYNRYASWGGWDASSPKEARMAYILKNLKNRWAWKGETVHHVIEEVLKSARAGQPMTFDVAAEKLTQMMRENYRSSKAKKYMQDPKKSMGLFEHEYEKPVTDKTWKTIHDEAYTCLKNFMSSDYYSKLLADDKKSWLVIEDLEEFQFADSKIYVKLDFAKLNKDVVEIYDWKTGKEEMEAEIQIGAYAIYAMQKWKIPLEKIKAYLVFVSSPNPVPLEQPLDKALITRTEKAISESIRGMKELLEDPKKNIPKPRDNFIFTNNERLCGYCNFYKMCEKYNSGTVIASVAKQSRF